jgi:hypothetical protein
MLIHANQRSNADGDTLESKKKNSGVAANSSDAISWDICPGEHRLVKTDEQSTSGLAPEDYQQIEDEHVQLHRLLNDLGEVCINLDNQVSCCDCDDEKKASCQGQLVSFTYNLAYLAENHFSNEEVLIKRWSQVMDKHESYHAHHQAHENIMAELQNIARQCASIDLSGNISVGYRKLHRRMSVLLKDHDRLFDRPFFQESNPGKMN